MQIAGIGIGMGERRAGLSAQTTMTTSFAKRSVWVGPSLVGNSTTVEHNVNNMRYALMLVASKLAEYILFYV